MANDIAVSMYLNNQQYMQGMNASKGALLIYNKQVGLSQKTMERFEQTMNQSSRALRINQSVMSNAVFMVEDMASVYGTMGLAGAVRAGSNNLTMMAAAFGPWAMAGAVAVTTATQLYLAFNKDADSAKNAKDAVDEYKDALDEQSGRIDNLTRLRRQLARATDSNETGGLKEQVQDDIASINEQIKAFEKQKRAEQDRRKELMQRGQQFEQAAGDNPMSSAAQAANAAFDAAKEQAEKVAETQSRINKLIEERAQKEQEAAMIAQKHNAIVRREVVQGNQEQIAAVQEQIQKDREAANAAIQNQRRVQDNARKNADDNQRMNPRFERRDVAQSTARGSSDFAKAFAATAQSLAGMTKRERMAAEAVARKKEKIENAPRRQIKEQMAARDKQEKSSEKLAKKQEEATKSMDELTEQIREQNRLNAQRPSDLSLSLGALDS